jgi:hypothetical protein
MKRTRTSMVAGILAAIIVTAAIPAAFAALHRAPSTPTNCGRDQLGVRANGTNGAAGTIHGAWVFTNLSRTTCTLDGNPDMQLYGRTGRPIRTVVRHDLRPTPSNVTLAPGASATFYSSYNDVPSGPRACARSAVAQITAPKGAASLFIPAQLQPCRAVVHVSAVLAGVHDA